VVVLLWKGSIIPYHLHEAQLHLEVVEQYPTWPNTQAFLQMIREEVTPETVNFSLPGTHILKDYANSDTLWLWLT